MDAAQRPGAGEQLPVADSAAVWNICWTGVRSRSPSRSERLAGSPRRGRAVARLRRRRPPAGARPGAGARGARCRSAPRESAAPSCAIADETAARVHARQTRCWRDDERSDPALVGAAEGAGARYPPAELRRAGTFATTLADLQTRAARRRTKAVPAKRRPAGRRQSAQPSPCRAARRVPYQSLITAAAQQVRPRSRAAGRRRQAGVQLQPEREVGGRRQRA